MQFNLLTLNANIGDDATGVDVDVLHLGKGALGGNKCRPTSDAAWVATFERTSNDLVSIF